jgi:glycine/D-amino acid oxidase-like deaminating enzyme
VRSSGNTLDPYHHVRIAGDLDADHQLLIVGGEDHKTGQAADADQRHARLVEWTRKRFPVLGEPLYRWSGQVMEPVDGLAFIGLNPGDRHIYIATGDSGNGMTHGTIAGMLLGDLTASRENAWAKVYEPSRKALKSLGEFAKENANVGGFPDGVKVDNSYVTPVLPSIGFEGKADLFREMKALAG